MFLTLAFYRLFAGVDRNLAVQVVIFGGVIPALLYFVGAMDDLGTLMAVHGADFLSMFDKPQRDVLAMLFSSCETIKTPSPRLFGVWLLPLALLVYRSRFLPAVAGRVAGARWLRLRAMRLTGVLWPQYQSKVFTYDLPAGHFRSRRAW